MSRTGKYIGGSTIIRTGNYGGPPRQGVDEQDPCQKIATPRSGGSKVNLAEQRKETKEYKSAKKRESRRSTAASFLIECREKFKIVESDVLKLQEKTATSALELGEDHPATQALRDRLIKRNNTLKKHRARLQKAVRADAKLSGADKNKPDL